MRRYMRQNDTKPYLTVQLRDATDDPVTSSVVNLTGATVKFIMRGSDGTAKVDATLAGSEYVNRTSGIVRYEWLAADTDTCDDYHAEFEVTDSEAAVTTYWDKRTAEEISDEVAPESLIISIVDDLA